LAVVVVFGCILSCLASSFCNLYSAACTTKFLVFCDWVGAWTISRYDGYRSCGLKECLMKEYEGSRFYIAQVSLMHVSSSIGDERR
jgi:hypothetical protein